MDEIEREAVRAYVNTWANVRYFRGRFREQRSFILYGAVVMAQEMLGPNRGLWLAKRCNELGVPPKDPRERRLWANGHVNRLMTSMPHETDEEAFA